MFKFRTSNFLLIFLTLTFINESLSALSKKPQDSNYLQKFVNEIQKDLDENVDPCEDFIKYSCGNSKIITVNDKSKDLLKKYFTDPRTQLETKIKDFYESCKGKDVFNVKNVRPIFEESSYFTQYHMFPVRDFDFVKTYYNEIQIRIAGIFIEPEQTSERLNLLKIYANNYTNLLENFDEIVDELATGNEILDMKDIKEAIVELKKFIKKYDTLMKKYDEAENSENKNVTSIEELEKILPSKMVNWDYFFDIIKDHWERFESKDNMDIEIRDFDLIKDFISLIDETDDDVIANFNIYTYVHDMARTSEDKCLESATLFASPVILKKFYDEKTGNQEDLKRVISVFNELEIHFNETTKDLTNFKGGFNHDYVQHIERIPRLKGTINDDNVEDFYTNYKFGNYYKNLDNFMKIKQEVLYKPKTHEVKHLILNELKEFVLINLKDTPFIQNFIIESYILWIDFLSDNNMFKDYTECLKEDESFMNKFGAIKLSLKHYLNPESDEFKTELEEVKRFMDPEKLFFTYMAQNLFKNKYGEENELNKIFRRFEEFSNTFSCLKESFMNHFDEEFNCEAENCPNSFIKNLLPFKYKNC